MKIESTEIEEGKWGLREAKISMSHIGPVV